MYYHSTRDDKIKYTASQAIMLGLAPDGGLFVPSEIPNWGHKLSRLVELSYQQLCFKIITEFFEEFRFDGQFKSDTFSAFDKFSASNIIEVHKTDGNYYLELFHGPTCAFKDLALSVLPFEVAAAKRFLKDETETAVLVATSGDTGKAALEAFGGQKNFKISVIYPKDGVSKIQEMQMVNTTEKNTFVCGLNGNFDDCQRLVKSMISQKYEGVNITSANSINIARLIPQITYYFYSYFLLVKQGEISLGDKINYSVPTGNFGNILSAYIARQMGLPIEKLICASNSNKVLADFFKTGIYDRRREFVLTQSPSMDILVASNFERLIWFATKDAKLVKKCMTKLNEDGFFDINSLLEFLPEFFGSFATEKQTSEEIKRVFSKYNYLIDTHTAVASFVSGKYATGLKTIIAATADPYKFCSAVLKAIGQNSESDDELSVLEELHQITGVAVPFPLADLKNHSTVHNNTGNADVIQEKIKNFLENKSND